MQDAEEWAAQSSLICACATTWAQRARSLLKNWSCSAGVMVTTSAPCPARRARMSGERMTRDQFLVEPLHDRVGRAARHQHALPGAGLETGHALLGDGRHVADQRHARALGNAQHLELAALHVRQRGEHAVHQHLGLAADGVLHGLHAALVGHVLPAWRRWRAPRATPARCGALPVAVTAKFRSVCLRQRHQFLQVVGRHRGVHHQQVRRIGQHGHAAQVLRRVERQLGVDRGADRQRADVAQQQRVAVRRRLGDEVGAQVAVGAGLVLHDHGLLERLRQRLADGAGDDVRRPAGRVRHDDAHGLGRPGGRLRPPAGRGAGGQRRCEQVTAVQAHGVSMQVALPGSLSCHRTTIGRQSPQARNCRQACQAIARRRVGRRLRRFLRAAQALAAVGQVDAHGRARRLRVAPGDGRVDLFVLAVHPAQVLAAAVVVARLAVMRARGMMVVPRWLMMSAK